MIDIKVSQRPSCPACAEPVRPEDGGKVCPDCLREFHAACWTGDDDEPCQGCPAALPAEPEAAPETEEQPAAVQAHHHGPPPGEEPRWLDDPQNVRSLVKVFWGLCGVILAVDLLAFVGWYHKHPHFDVETFPGFYGFYGFVACVALVLVAKQLRKVVMRGERYYE